MSEKTPLQKLYQAVDSGEVTKARSMLAERPELLHEDVIGGTWLHLAAENDDVPMAEMLAAAGLDVNGGKHFKPLTCAARNGAVHMARWLLDQGVDPNWDRMVIAAVNGGSPEVLRLLVEHGADVNATFKDETAPGNPPMNALSQAILHGREDLESILREAGAAEPGAPERNSD